MRGVVFVTLILGLGCSAWAEPFWLRQTPGDPALALALLPAQAAGETRLAAGYDSGEVACFDVVSAGGHRPAWKTRLAGSILALRPMPDIDADGIPELVASTDLGTVACIRGGGPEAGKIHWSVNATFNISQLVVLRDSTGDGVSEVAFGGADHRVTLLDGASGSRRWSRLLELPDDIAYVDCLADAGDLNGDGIDDLFVRTWAAHRWAISGADGSDLWSPRAGDPFLSSLIAAGDANGDGAGDLLESGNDGVLRLCNGRDGAELWRCRLGRPVRAMAVLPRAAGQAAFACVAGTAEGKVACISGASSADMTIRWTAAMGDMCRIIVIQGDLDEDGVADVVAGAENGVVAAFSGADGATLWKQQGGDVVRTLAVLPDLNADGVPDLAVSLIDGTVTVLSGKSPGPLPAVAQMPPAAREPSARGPASRPAGKLSSDVAEVAILLYHDVPPEGLRSTESSPLANFREQMDFLVADGYTAVALDDLAEWIEGRRELPAKPVVITFDGQYASHDTHLFEILRERGLFAISYITTDWIGTANHLDWHELRRLERSGVVLIENHTFNHPTLTTVSGEEVVRQLRISNDAIANHLDGKRCRQHAYPNGFCNFSAREIVRKEGFRTATAVIHRRATRSDDLFALPRYTIVEQLQLPSFRAILGHSSLPYPALPYRYAGSVGSGWRQPSYGDVDAEGKLWICDISANVVRVFLADGTEAPFSPIDTGIKQNGESMPMRSPAGVAVTPSGDVLVSISSRYGAMRHSGLFRYRAADGTRMAGVDLPYYPGDVDTDAAGLIYVVDKLTGQWHVYTPQGKEVAGSPFGRDAGVNVCRGIAVTPDASRVYVLSESDANVRTWKGAATADSARYEPAGLFVEHLSSGCGGVDVTDDGTVLVGYHDEGMVVAFDADRHAIGQISGGPVPSFAEPRGTIASSDGGILWIIGRLGQVQRWERVASR